MKTLVLIFPPQGDPTMPPQVLGCLSAYLKEAVSDLRVVCIDANVEACDFLLTKRYLEIAYKKIERTAKQLENNLSGKDKLLHYKTLCRAIPSASFVVDSIDDAVKTIRREEIIDDFDLYYSSASIVSRALNLISAAHFPTVLDIGGFSTQFNVQSSSDIASAAQDYDGNPFLSYYQEILLQKIKDVRPDLIGISMAYPTQIHQTFFLVNMFSSELAKIPIVIGGSMIPMIVDKLPNVAHFFDSVLGFVGYEGELALCSLMQTKDMLAERAKIPGLIYKDVRGDIVQNESEYIDELEKLPTPNYQELPLDLYFSPKLVLPYSLGRGCYWGKCVFCCQDLISRGHFRKKNKEIIARELCELNETYNCSHLFICDEGLDPETLATMGDVICEKKLGFNWSSDARISNKWNEERINRVARGGGIKLWFGLESYNQETLDRIDKGIRTEDICEVVLRCNKEKVLVHLYCMFGFPGETEEDLERTLDFLIENREGIDTISINGFRLHRFSKMYHEPEKFQIRLLKNNKIFDMPHDEEFETLKGLKRKEAVAFRDSVEVHPMMANLQAPFILSKAHMLVLAAKDRSYKDKVIEAAKTKGMSQLEGELESNSILHLASHVEVFEFVEDVFGPDNIDGAQGQKYYYAYSSKKDRHFKINHEATRILFAFEQKKMIKDVDSIDFDMSSLYKSIKNLVNAGLLEVVLSD